MTFTRLSSGTKTALALLLTLLSLGTPRSMTGQDKPTAPEKPANPPSESTDSKKTPPPTPAHQDTLKSLERDLFRPLEMFSPKSSLDAASPVPVRPLTMTPQVSRRMQEERERRKDWTFLKPEELVSESSMDEILKLSKKDKEDPDKPRQTPMERFYERLQKRNPDGTSKESSKDQDVYGLSKNPNAIPGVDDQEDNSIPANLRESQKALRKLFNSDSNQKQTSSQPKEGSFLSDIFGLNRAPQSKEEMEAHKLRMKAYGTDVLGIPASPAATLGSWPATSPFNDPARISSAPVVAADGLPGTSKSFGFSPQQTSLTRIQDPSHLNDINQSVFGSSTLAPALPKADVQRITPPSPTFNAPRRVF